MTTANDIDRARRMLAGAKQALAAHDRAALSDTRLRERLEQVIAAPKREADAIAAIDAAAASVVNEWGRRFAAGEDVGDAPPAPPETGARDVHVERLQSTERAAAAVRPQLDAVMARLTEGARRRDLLVLAVEVETSRVVAGEAAPIMSELCDAAARVRTVAARIIGAREFIRGRGERSIEHLRILEAMMPIVRDIGNAAVDVNPLRAEVDRETLAWQTRALALAEPLPEETVASVAAE